MKENLFRKILKLEEKVECISMQKNITSKSRKRNIIPEEYFIEVIPTIPEKKAIIEQSDI